jgi:hypothetical protein
VLEVPVKRILMGADRTKVVSRDSLANPEALDYFVGLGVFHKSQLSGAPASGRESADGPRQGVTSFESPSAFGSVLQSDSVAGRFRLVADRLPS